MEANYCKFVSCLLINVLPTGIQIPRGKGECPLHRLTLPHVNQCIYRISDISAIRVARSLVFYVMFCRSLRVLSFFLLCFVCPWQVPLVEHEPLTLPEHILSLWGSVGFILLNLLFWMWRRRDCTYTMFVLNWEYIKQNMY